MILLASAGLLFAAAVTVWFVAAGARPAARLQLRFAAVLMAALALSAGASLTASAAGLLVLPIALGVLALAAAAGLSKPVAAAPAAILLAVACLAGLAAVVSGLAILSLAPAAAALVTSATIFARRFEAARLAALQGLLSVLCFLGAVSAFALEGAGAAVFLFAAAGLLGFALALARSDVVVEEGPARDLRGGFAIGGRRQI